MDDEPIVPLFAHNEPGPRFKVGRMAKLLEEPGTPAKTLESQIRSLAQRRLIHVRGAKGGGPTAHNLYALADLAAVGVFSRLATDISIADNEHLQEISRALYTWYDVEPQPAGHMGSPILTAVKDTFENPDRYWVLDHRVYRHVETGIRKTHARLYEASDRTGAEWSLFGDDYERRGTVTIHLRPLILTIKGRMFAN